eukprot:COSAG04_NODE_32048_length_253_cov_0.805195_1_plen_33_part_10
MAVLNEREVMPRDRVHGALEEVGEPGDAGTGVF